MNMNYAKFTYTPGFMERNHCEFCGLHLYRVLNMKIVWLVSLQ